MVMCSKKYLYNGKSLSIKKQYGNDNNDIYNNMSFVAAYDK
jgi:hypothetical protein